MAYIHQLEDWPNFTWSHGELLFRLGTVRNMQGKLMGRMLALGFGLQQEAVLETLTLDVLKSTDHTLTRVLHKAKFWERHRATAINERQRLMINKLFDGFYGKLGSSKWAKIAKCSPDTALRDMQDLMHKGVLSKESAGGRSTNYALNTDAPV